MIKSKALSLVFILAACSTPSTKEIVEKKARLEGETRVVFTEKDRLVIYLLSEDKVYLCHVYNNSNGRLLQHVEGLTKRPGTFIVLYGENVKSDAEYISGVDFIASTLEIMHPIKHEKVFIDMNYGDRIKDSFSVKAMAKKLLNTVSDKALSAVK